MNMSSTTTTYSLVVAYLKDDGTAAYTGLALPSVATLTLVASPGTSVWYLTVTDTAGTLKEAAKIRQPVSAAFTTATVRLGNVCAGATTFLDFSFKMTNAVVASGLILLTFPITMDCLMLMERHSQYSPTT